MRKYIDTPYFSIWEKDLINLNVRGQTLGFAAQGFEVAVEGVVAYHHTHAAVDAGRRFAEDADVGILLARQFDALVVRRFLTGNGRENDRAGTDA